MYSVPAIGYSGSFIHSNSSYKLYDTIRSESEFKARRATAPIGHVNGPPRCLLRHITLNGHSVLLYISIGVCILNARVLSTVKLQLIIKLPLLDRLGHIHTYVYV